MKKENNIKFSVVIPVYNAEKFIERCVESILNQTYIDFELIIINDGSKDNSWDLLNEKYKENKKIKLFNQENKGVSATRNFGIENSTGDWITFVDADDWIEIDTLSKINTILKKDEKIKIIMSNLFYNKEELESTPFVTSDLLIDNNNKMELIETIIAIDYGQSKYGSKFGNCRCIGGKFYDLNFLKNNKINFLTNLVSYEDGILNLYASYLAENIYIYSKPLYHYYFNINSRTNRINNNQFSQNKLIINEISKFLKTYNIKSNSVNYCCLDLFTMLINNNIIKYGFKNRKDGIKNFKKEYFDFEINIKSKKIINEHLTKKNKLLNLLLKHKNFRLIYMLYLIKNYFSKM